MVWALPAEACSVKRLDRCVLAVAIGAVPPIAGLLAGWWGTFTVWSERGVMIAALGGLAGGLILDVVLLRRAVEKAHSAPLWMWAAIYVFYSVGAFGFLMGVPVLNALLGVPAGLLFAGRLAHEGASPDQVRRQAKLASAFTTAILAVACIASAALALGDPYTASGLEEMLFLPFRVTTPMILGLIVVGGSVLLATQAWVTRATIRWAHRKLTPAG